MAEQGTTTGDCDIEAVVREVLARLSADRQSVPPQTKSNERVIHDRVITLSSINGNWENIQTLVVPQRAVITPAAGDLLREKKIAVRRSSAAPAAAAASPAGTRALVLGMAETSFVPAALVEQLGRGGYRVEQLAHTGMAEVIAELTDAAVKGGGAAVLLTEACELAMCLANRRRGVRAALGTDRQGVRRACEQIGANVLIVNPSVTIGFQLQQTLREFFDRSGHCPERWSVLLS